MKNFQIVICWMFTLIAKASVGSAQLIAYESFSGMPVGGGINGSGSDATGWTEPSWQGASSPYLGIGNQSPNMTYQITNGALLNGEDRCAIISTAPEPTAGTNAVTRTLPPLNSTFFMSFLVRPLSVGTGSDSLMVQFRSGSTLLGGVEMLPNTAQSSLLLNALQAEGAGSGGSSGNTSLSANVTYFVVLKVSRPNSFSFSCEGWINPTQTPQPSRQFYWTSSSVPTNASSVDRVSLNSYSFDNGGPSTSAAIDEIRLGYTWNDVVPESTTQTVVPTLSIAPAVAVNWQSKEDKSYQPQRSYDLTNWVNFGSTISGDGQQQSFFDSADQVPRSFYRVIER
jgi:hypothetical protein